VTNEQWWQVVDLNWDNLCAIVDSYHPGYGRRNHDFPITAIAAEAACEVFREEIHNEAANELESPLRRFLKAKELRDDETLSTILSQTWFGIPDSTSCWSIPGFGKLCDLLDDPINSIEE